LVDALRSTAALVKPSARELAGVIGRTLGDERAIEAAAKEVLADSAVGALLVSIGSGGAFLCTRDAVRRFRAPSVQVRSAVGAGDSLVAGIAVGLSRGQSLADAAALGIACGSAAVMSEGTELCSLGDVEALLPLVESR
jgi:6-phosphofructokinase 2